MAWDNTSVSLFEEFDTNKIGETIVPIEQWNTVLPPSSSVALNTIFDNVSKESAAISPKEAIPSFETPGTWEIKTSGPLNLEASSIPKIHNILEISSHSEDTTIPEAMPLPPILESLGEKQILISEIVGEKQTQKDQENVVREKKETDKITDATFQQYLLEDTIYQSMIRLEWVSKIRTRLAIRYTLLLLAFFLAFAWIVSNRVIMFGLDDFPLLSRVRDGLFGVMSWLFCLTLWFGSEVWSEQKILISFLKTLSVILFISILWALYLPL